LTREPSAPKPRRPRECGEVDSAKRASRPPDRRRWTGVSKPEANWLAAQTEVLWGKAFLSSWGRIANPPSPVQIREGPLLPHSVSPARNGPHLLQFPAVAGGCSSITPRAPNPRAKPLSGLFSCAAGLR